MPLVTLELDTSWGRLRIAGGSRAGEGTLILLPQLRLALDPGRPHRALPPMSTVAISHGHMDHLAALGYWASQRQLHAMGRATVLAPQEIAEPVSRLLALGAELEGGEAYPVDIVPVAAGGLHRLRRDLEMEFFATDHWVPTLGVRLLWMRHRLHPDLVDLPGEEIARRRRAGHEVSRTERALLLAYCADSGPGVLRLAPDVLGAEVLLVECSFFRTGDRDRAERYGHLHLEDLLAVADRLRCRHLVLLHGSRRHRLREIEDLLAERLAPELGCQLHHLMVDWE